MHGFAKAVSEAGYVSDSLIHLCSLLDNNNVPRSELLAKIGAKAMEEYNSWRKLQHFSEAPLSFVVDVLKSIGASNSKSSAEDEINGAIISVARTRGSDDIRFYEIGPKTKFRGKLLGDFINELLSEHLSNYMKYNCEFGVLRSLEDSAVIRNFIVRRAIFSVQDSVE